MSMYTTGEIVRLCGAPGRTVQYYDSREILIPSQLSEGGRRLYSEDDLRRLRLLPPLRAMRPAILSRLTCRLCFKLPLFL